MILIKSGFFEIWAIHVAPMTTKDTLTLSDGLTLNKKHLDIVYDVSCRIFFQRVIFFVQQKQFLSQADSYIYSSY